MIVPHKIDSGSRHANRPRWGETRPFHSSADPLIELVTIHRYHSPSRCVLCWIVPQTGADGKRTDRGRNEQQRIIDHDRQRPGGGGHLRRLWRSWKRDIAFWVVLRYNDYIEGTLRCSRIQGIDQADVDGLIEDLIALLSRLRQPAAAGERAAFGLSHHKRRGANK
jgi:hypothetical protein